MFGQAEILLSEGYYRESYEEWFRHVARFRKWQTPLAIVAAVASIALWLSGFRLAALVPAAYAVLKAVDAVMHRRQWIADRCRSSRLDETISVQFSDEALEINGPHSSGSLAWAGVDSWEVTDRGLFLRPDTGVSIYVPKASVTPPEAVGQIVECLERASSGGG